jgi:hypothetical protein
MDGMENKLFAVEEIIKKLQSSSFMVMLGTVDGIDVEATMNEAKVTFHYRLDAFHRPTRQEALAILTRLHDCFAGLCRSSAVFREFVGDRKFEAELYVFSGQMDFTVATMDARGVTWRVALDD